MQLANYLDGRIASEKVLPENAIWLTWFVLHWNRDRQYLHGFLLQWERILNETQTPDTLVGGSVPGGISVWF
jgi:hypothetical protein